MKLQTAVIKAINEFAFAKKSFSAYNVTKLIREKVNAGEWEIWDDAAQDYTKFIGHDAVRSFVHDLYNEGTLKNFGITHREDNGTFKTYIFGADGDAYVDDADEIVSDEVVDSAPVVAPVELDPVDAPTAVCSNLDSTTKSKIEKYLDNASNLGLIVSMKQIQSAIKVNGVTCQDIYDYIDELGYAIDGESDPVSTRTVAF